MSSPYSPNMRPLKPSRRWLKPGDIFAMHYPKVGYLFGRVILVKIPGERAPMPGCNLIYVYDVTAPDLDIDTAALSPNRLLVPPVFINRLPWSRGYFQTVKHVPMADSDLLSDHCFYWDPQGVCMDLMGNKRPTSSRPCGVWGLDSYASLDDQISDALGIGRVPE